MTSSEGKAFCELLLAMWQINADRLVWSESGFDWWPGHYKVNVQALAGDVPATEDAWRLSVTTDFLTGINIRDERILGLMLQMASFSPTYSWVATPPAAIDQYAQPDEGRVQFKTTVYVRPSTAGWLPAFLGKMAILQPIDAERMAVSIADMLGGRPDQSAPPGCTDELVLDDMLNVAQALYAPEGAGDSRWSGSDEFEQIAQTYGRNDRCFGMGDPSGLTLETPIGQGSALIRLNTDIRHPALGAGLLASAQLPFTNEKPDVADECLWFHFFESVQWTDVPQLGSWHPRELRDNQFSAGHSFFVPNLLYQDQLPTNAALWQLGRARWVKQQFWPDLEDATMADILQARFQR